MLLGRLLFLQKNKIKNANTKSGYQERDSNNSIFQYKKLSTPNTINIIVSVNITYFTR